MVADHRVTGPTPAIERDLNGFGDHRPVGATGLTGIHTGAQREVTSMLSRGALRLVSSRTRRGIALSWSVLFILSLLLQYATFALAPAALAVHDDGLFELDGNAVNQVAAGDDWDKVFDGSSSAEATKFVTDPVDDQSDPSFTGGSSKDDHDTTDWLWKHAKVGQPKNDITHAFAAAYTAATGDDAGDKIVYFGLDKLEADGDNF